MGNIYKVTDTYTDKDKQRLIFERLPYKQVSSAVDFTKQLTHQLQNYRLDGRTYHASSCRTHVLQMAVQSLNKIMTKGMRCTKRVTKRHVQQYFTLQDKKKRNRLLKVIGTA